MMNKVVYSERTVNVLLVFSEPAIDDIYVAYRTMHNLTQQK